VIITNKNKTGILYTNNNKLNAAFTKKQECTRFTDLSTRDL